MRTALTPLAIALLVSLGCSGSEDTPTDDAGRDDAGDDGGGSPDGGVEDASEDAEPDADATVDPGIDPRRLTPQNTGAPVGTNLSDIRDWSSELPFIDLFRASRAWISNTTDTWDDGRPIDVDEHGWVRSLAEGQRAVTAFNWELEQYPRGTYFVLYEGSGSFEYVGGARRLEGSTPGRDVIELTEEGRGFALRITATTAGDHLRNFRVVADAGACDDDVSVLCSSSSPCATGAACLDFETHHEELVFHPTFLQRIAPYRVLRFMNWMDANESTLRTFDERPRVDDARWSVKGAPIEILTALANRVGADMWITIPHLADDDYVTRFAEQVRDLLDPDLRVYIEHSNEIWNSVFSQSTYTRERGVELGLSTDPYEAQVRYHSRRSVEIFTLFEQAFGGTSRLVRVMGSQAANAWISTTALEFENAASHTDALAIAPYFGGALGYPAEQARLSTATVDDVFAEMSTHLEESYGWMAASADAAEANGVELIAYEGGQHIAGVLGVENDETLNSLFDAVNRDPRMGTAYTEYLERFEELGGGMFVHFQNCGAWSKWGRWGALEYIDQPRAEAPKYDAIMTYITAHSEP